MALPSSGAISFSQINTELGLSSTAQISLNDSVVRTLFGKASGAITMSDGRGKANQFAFTISSNQTNANLATLATAAGWNGTSKVVATISSGVYVYSTSTGTPALTVSGSFPGGVELVNNGNIYGMGGAGGSGGGYNPNAYNPSAGASGGNALTVSVPISITNNSVISGGGGGGGGGGRSTYTDGKFIISCGGGGGGGGRVNGSGAGGGAGQKSGASGSSASLTAVGSGGAGGYESGSYGGTGGSGGNNASPGSSGANGVTNYDAGAGASGGSGGSAVSGNSNITWVATGTRYGAIS